MRKKFQKSKANYKRSRGRGKFGGAKHSRSSDDERCSRRPNIFRQASQNCSSSNGVHHTEAWRCLWTNGYQAIREPAPAYSLLVHMAESQQRDRSCVMVLDTLKTLMHEPFDAPVRRTRREVWRLVKQLQSKRKPMSLRHKTGLVLYDPHAIASEITSFWQQTMSVGGRPLNEYHSYLASLFTSKNVPLMEETLIKPLTVPLVHAALLALNRTSA